MSASRGAGWRVRLAVLGTFALVFLAGGAAGVAWERARGEEPLFRVRVSKGGGVDAFDRLDLTPEQRRRIEEIFVRSQPRTDAVLREALPRIRAVADSIDAEVRAVLTPEQRSRLDRASRRRVLNLEHPPR